ncbi:MAG: hypothetical protein ACKVPY_08020 [Paracoccaceae bacterium]
MTDAFRAAFDAIPEGYSEGSFLGRRWRIAKSVGAGGKGAKLVAHELGGTGFVSLNLYALAKGDRLKPCEMSEGWVRAFVTGVTPLP